MLLRKEDNMNLRFFNNIINNEIDTKPNNLYRDLQQEFINIQWDNTTALEIVQEQEDIGINCYHDLQVWLVPTVSDTSTGMKDVRDFNKLIFKDITHTVKRGLMYKFDNCYWLVHSYSEYDGVVQDCGIRRCNNFLRMIDPLNGSVFSIPCVVDYDMAASTVKVTKYILTPNNHAVVLVQGNQDTLRLFKTNTRFILSGRPFKLYGYQNAVEYSAEEQSSTLLYLDLYLDEIRDGDDIENSIAENEIYNYSIFVNSKDLILSAGSSGSLSANVLLNGKEVERSIYWKSSDNDIVSIDMNGDYILNGEIGQVATITAYLDGNEKVFDSINITVGEQGEDISILLNPSFDKIRQYSTINFNIEVYYNGNLIKDNLDISCSTDSEILTIFKNEDYYSITSEGISTDKQNIIVVASCSNPVFEKTENIEISAVSMLG
jgi:hypothetical protein